MAAHKAVFSQLSVVDFKQTRPFRNRMKTALLPPIPMSIGTVMRVRLESPLRVPHGLTLTWFVCCGLCLWHKPTEFPHSFLLCHCVCFCLYDPFNCISFHRFSRQLSAFSLCSSGLISVLLAFSTIYLCMKVSFSPDIIPSGWLGSKHQITN